MPGSILLDTCAAIWITEEAELHPRAQAALDESAEARVPVMVSPTSAWEMGMLIARRRATSAMSVRSWFDSLVIPPFSETAALTTDILINSSFLPGNPPRDPFDRLFIATAREHGYRIMTRDRKILDYAEQGHVQVIPC
ncbi:type II toxin-antitoxin system VapC family toxin [Mesorhizobium sp. BAC0120]|uniref:type II toxin-antitoxin system VapC family toxin n=1 Tax=Mesorhizobium sp. BAC0120 TaxID=3090670 RepID=UPI00298CBE1A|nr:type II toxin-antitoxin system VapC family toxin [Mesorhizobium sp. BAC0120]MDW6025027.1 type II toxin-antitoxin system VapC family toxin [Mesorhizobium sp. BAC0120]